MCSHLSCISSSLRLWEFCGQGGCFLNPVLYCSRITHKPGGEFSSTVPSRGQLSAGLGSRARCFSPRRRIAVEIRDVRVDEQDEEREEKVAKPAARCHDCAVLATRSLGNLAEQTP